LSCEIDWKDLKLRTALLENDPARLSEFRESLLISLTNVR